MSRTIRYVVWFFGIWQVADVAACFPACPLQASITLDTQLVSNDNMHTFNAQMNGRFGGALALSGTSVLIGADGQTAAHVFVRTGNTWSHEAELDGPMGSAIFGCGVDLDGDRALIGARGGTGKAYVSERQSGAWSLPSEIPSSANGNDEFGFAVALDGDTAIIGAPGEDMSSSITNIGTAWIFVAGSPTWTEQQEIPNPSPATNDNYGQAVAIEGETVFVGAPTADPSSVGNAGSVRVFNRSGTAWTEDSMSPLLAPTPTASELFGSSLAVANDWLVVGAPYAGAPGQPEGSVYVFHKDISGWTFKSRVIPGASMNRDQFGASVGFDGSVLAVAAPGFRIVTSILGAAYLFRLCGQSFYQDGSLVGSTSTAGFGGAIDVLGDRLVVGVPLDDVVDPMMVTLADAGTVNTYHFPDVKTYCTSGTTTNGCVAAICAMGTPSATGTSGFDLITHEVEGQRNGLLFYGTSGAIASPWGSGGSSFLCVKAPTQRMTLLLSGGTAGLCDGVLSEDWLSFIAAHPTALGTPLQTGNRFWAQAWFRDPPAVKQTSLSDALTFALLP